MDTTKVKHVISAIVKNLTFRVAGVSISLADLQGKGSVDERIARLGKIKADLEAAIAAVGELQTDASTSKTQVDELRKDIASLEQDKATAEHLLNVPEESYARLHDRATRRGQRRGIIIGFISSYTVWYVTLDKAAKPTQSAPVMTPATNR